MSLAAAVLLAAASSAASPAIPPRLPDIADPRDEARVAIIDRVAKSVMRIKSVKPALDYPDPMGLTKEQAEKLKRKDALLFERMRPKPRPVHEEGTGFVYDSARGLILTAAHIADTGGTITVYLSDGSEKPGVLLGADRDIGVTVLKVEGLALPALTVSARKPRIGETMLVVGRLLPFDSVGASQGMVIGEARGADQFSGDRPALVDYLMLDNLLPNGGMGGGPVVNMRGDVVGITSAIWGRNGYGQESATLAVPLADLRPQIEELVRSGKIVRSQIGVNIDCDADDCRIIGMKPGGAAGLAGLREGDVLVSVEGTPVTSAGTLRRKIAPLPVGSEATIVVRRDGQMMTVKVKTVESASGSFVSG